MRLLRLTPGFSRDERAIVPVDDEGRYVDASGAEWIVCRNLKVVGCTWLSSSQEGSALLAT